MLRDMFSHMAIKSGIYLFVKNINLSKGSLILSRSLDKSKRLHSLLGRLTVWKHIHLEKYLADSVNPRSDSTSFAV